MLIQRELLLVLSSVSPLIATVSWGFGDGTISLQTKGAGIGGGLKESLNPTKPLKQIIQLGSSDTLKIAITTQEGKVAKRAHQAFLNLRDTSSSLETSFALSVKESGKAKLEISQKDLPFQLLVSDSTLAASLVIASFGASTPYSSEVFSLKVSRDSNEVAPILQKPLRYGKLPELHHTFKADPKNPPKIISLFFGAIVLAALPALLLAWLSLGANVNHISKAFSTAPVSHGLFFGSILAMEGIFFKYYTSWTLFQTLPVAIGIGSVIFLSGSRALTEVQSRRLAGLR